MKIKLPTGMRLLDRISFVDKLMLTKHLAVMIKSGIPLAEAISTSEEQTKNTALKKVLQGVLKEVNNGQSLSKSLAGYPQVFDALSVNLVGIGEKSGKLEENLEYLAVQQAKAYEFKKKVQGAMLYPLLVLSVTVVIGGSLSLFVLPKLTDLFKSLDVPLPLSTKILLWFSALMRDDGFFIAGAVLILGVALSVLLRHPAVKPSWHKFLLSLPIFGLLLQNIELASICRNIGLMLKSGLTLPASLEAQYQAEGNFVYKKYLAQIQQSVDKGKSVEETLTKGGFPKIPHFMAKMVGVGEKTGKLEETLSYLGDFFEEEVDDTMKNLANILEPLLLIIIGLVVAFVALSIISPIYELTGGIKK
ncbi:MAG: type II secretion system F family protein [bacterium]|nr:type II secretion system F family protein [bacterium]